jgi:hypothetical protein
MYRTVDSLTWEDPWFRRLEPDGKLLFLYLFTNSLIGPSGAMEITVEKMQFDTGLTGNRFSKALSRLQPKVMWWPELDVAWVRNFYKHQRANSNDFFTRAARKAALGFAAEVQAVIYGEYPELSSNNEGRNNPTPIPPTSHPRAPTSDRGKETVTEQNRTVAVTERETHAPAKPTHSDEQILGLLLDTAMRSWATENAPDIDIQEAANDFVDWLHEHNVVRADYVASFRRWLRREKRIVKPHTNGAQTNGKSNGYETSRQRQDAAGAAAYDLFFAPPDGGRVADEDPPASRPRLAGPPQRAGAEVVDVTARHVGRGTG